MPGLVSLPRTYRPRSVRLAVLGAAIALVVVMTTLWLLLSADIRSDFTAFQRVTLLVFLGAVLAGLYGVFRTAVTADEQGLTVVNGYRVRRFEWAELVRISLTTHRPWALLDLSDGLTVSAMAIQSADGDRARQAIRELSALLIDRTRTDTDA